MVELDIAHIIPQDLLTLLESRALVEVLLDRAAESARAKWLKLATSELHSSRQTYADGIQEIETSPGVRTITLLGWLANAIENGLDPYDMRDTLLGAGAKNRRPVMSKDGKTQIGWYANVPFRSGTPGTTGLAGTPMGAPYGPRSQMSRALSGGLSPTEASQLGRAVHAEALRRRGKPLSAEHGGPLLAPHHTTGIYTGMRRVGGEGRAAGHKSYFSFRRISTVNGKGWIHPGIEPHRFSERAGKFLEEIMPRLVQSVMSSISNGQ